MDFMRLVAAVSVVAFVMGCSQGSDIQLGGSNPSPPGSPTTPADTSGNPTDPSAPKDPTTGPGATPTPRPPIATRYRMLCDDRYPPYLNAISSLASPSGFGAGIEVGELKANGTFDPQVDRNLEYHSFPQIVSLPKFGEARVLFSARRTPKAGNTGFGYTRYLFITDMDITTRGGVAKFIANDIGVAGTIENAAALETFGVRAFGASDQGRYLLIGTKDGYELRDSTTLKSLGLIKVGTASMNFNPSLRESDMIFSVSNQKGSAFETRLYSLGLTIDGKLKTSNLVTTATSLRRPLVPVSGAAGDSFAAINSSNRVVTISPLKRAGTSAIVKIAGLPAKGRLSSAAAFWRDAVSGETHAAIVFENISQTGGGFSARYKIEQVFIRVLNVDESTLSADAITPDFDYPPEARQTIESGIGIGVVPGVSELKTSPDGKAIFGLFPGSLSKQVYRLNSMTLDRVSQESCSNLSIGVEK